MITEKQALEIAAQWGLEEDVRIALSKRVHRGIAFWRTEPLLTPEEALEEFDIPIPEEYLK